MNAKRRRTTDPRDNDPVKIALDMALTQMLNPQAKATVLLHFEIKHKISMGSAVPLTRGEAEAALRDFFGSGYTILMDAFEKNLSRLAEQSNKSSMT